MPRKNAKKIDDLPQAAAPKKKSARKALAPSAIVTVDYPQDAELITSPSYTIRVSAQDAWSVELSIDGAAWQACRESLGCWWYDWSGYVSGTHQFTARRRGAAGRWRQSSVRIATVSLA